MVIMMKCSSNMHDFTITMYEIWNGEGARGGTFKTLGTI